MAVSIPPGSLVLPAGHIDRRNLRSDIARILEAVSQRQAVAIVVGMPYDAQGRPGQQARKIQSVVRALERSAAVPVFVQDEAFTSSSAEAELRASGRRPSREPGAVDAGAAAAILRRFINPDPPLP